MTRREKFARALLAPINPAAVVIMGVYTVGWGLWVANPFWHAFTRAPLYSALIDLAPEIFWGILAIVVGAITIYGAWKRKYRYLVRGACAAGWHWLMITIFYFMGDWMSTGGITSLMITVYAAFVYLNLRVNFKNDKDSKQILH